MYDSLIEHGLFVPRQLDQAHFDALWEALSDRRNLGLFNPYLNDTTSVSIGTCSHQATCLFPKHECSIA